MVLAQQLYEEGLITYHRTDSTNIAAPAITMARQYIHSKFGDEFLPEQPNFFATKSKNAQEAHEAIRPTGPQATMPEQGKLTGSHAKLYDLIFRRFMASQMNDARYEQTTIDVEGREGQQTLVARANGSVIKHAGWMALFPNSEETVLPTMKAGQSLTYQDLLTAQKFTQPPARFNDASLVKELEKRGIGRPSTYASIISVLLDRAYVDRVQKAFVPTAVGKTVALFLTLNFADVVDYDFTAHMEDDLDEIALGNKQWQKVLGEFYTPFLAKLKDVEKTAKRMTVPVEPLDKPCPKCGLAEADYAQAQDKHQTLLTMSPADREKVVLREQPHGELVIRAGKFGKFISCSRYPECDYTEKFLDKLDMVCPQCGEGQVVAKKTKKGRTFYGCSRYPACDFASWKKPGTKEEE
jgi:DNA topoisomerase-1